MTKLFSVERDFDGGIKVIAGNMTKTYNNLQISTVSFLFGLSEYVARSAELFEKYVKPEQEAEFSDRMLKMVNRAEKLPWGYTPLVHNVSIGGENGVAHISVSVQVDRIEFTFAFAMKDSDKTFDAIIHDIAVKKLISVIK
jgi:hypothetical protein